MAVPSGNAAADAQEVHTIEIHPPQTVAPGSASPSFARHSILSGFAAVVVEEARLAVWRCAGSLDANLDEEQDRWRWAARVTAAVAV